MYVGMVTMKGWFYLCRGGDGLVVHFRSSQVGRVLCDFKGVQSLGGCEEAYKLHVSELVCEDSSNTVLAVHVVWEIHVDGVSADVRVFSILDSCEVIVVDEDGTVCRG
jgi:hypothetical protein